MFSPVTPILGRVLARLGQHSTVLSVRTGVSLSGFEFRASSMTLGNLFKFSCLHVSSETRLHEKTYLIGLWVSNDFMFINWKELSLGIQSLLAFHSASFNAMLIIYCQNPRKWELKPTTQFTQGLLILPGPSSAELTEAWSRPMNSSGLPWKGPELITQWSHQQ